MLFNYCLLLGCGLKFQLLAVFLIVNGMAHDGFRLEYEDLCCASFAKKSRCLEQLAIL